MRAARLRGQSGGFVAICRLIVGLAGSPAWKMRFVSSELMQMFATAAVHRLTNAVYTDRGWGNPLFPTVRPT